MSFCIKSYNVTLNVNSILGATKGNNALAEGIALNSADAKRCGSAVFHCNALPSKGPKVAGLS